MPSNSPRKDEAAATTPQGLLRDMARKAIEHDLIAGPVDQHIPLAEAITQPTPAAYKLPAWLAKTALEKQTVELERLLADLVELNREFVGWRTLEAQTHINVTGRHDELEEGFRVWCHEYFTRRGDAGRIGPAVSGCAGELFIRCLGEFDELFRALIVMPRSLNSSVLNLSEQYLPWVLTKQLLAPEYAAYKTARPSRISANNLDGVREKIESQARSQNRFTEFVNVVFQHLPPALTLRNTATWKDETLRRIARDADAIGQMRLLLWRGFKPENTIQELAPGVWADWDWIVKEGRVVAMPHIAGSRREVLENIEASCTTFPIAFQHDGLMCHLTFPWLASLNRNSADSKTLAVNHYVLSRSHDLLFTLYDKIDFDRIRRMGCEASATPEEIEEAIAASAAESPPDIDTTTLLSDVAESTERKSKPRLRGMRLLRFCSILQREFGCDAGPGKGSEYKITRPGGTYYRFGKHCQDRDLHPRNMKDCLDRLRIPVAEWIQNLGNK